MLPSRRRREPGGGETIPTGWSGSGDIRLDECNTNWPGGLGAGGHDNSCEKYRTDMNVLIKLYQEAAVTAAVYEKVVQKTAVVGDVFNVYQESRFF